LNVQLYLHHQYCLLLHELKYSASDLEALACLCTLWACEKWDLYLYGRRFTFVTDHQALGTLLTAGVKGHKTLVYIGGAIAYISTPFDAVYQRGREHYAPDFLSRTVILRTVSAWSPSTRDEPLPSHYYYIESVKTSLS